MFDGDLGRAHGEYFTDGWSVQLGDRASCASEEDVGDRGALPGVGALVDVEHDLPRGARLYSVEVAQGHDGRRSDRSIPSARPSWMCQDSVPKHSPKLEGPPGLPSTLRHGQIASQLHASK